MPAQNFWAFGKFFQSRLESIAINPNHKLSAMNTFAIFRRKPLFWTLVLLSALISGSSFAANCPALLNHKFNRLQDEAPQDLCQYTGKVTLVVNTASYCGFTSQYEGLEKLYAKYKDRGLVVLGFPSNDFSQEPDGNKKIADFCYNTYGVKFPMFSKSSVRGGEALQRTTFHNGQGFGDRTQAFPGEFQQQAAHPARTGAMAVDLALGVGGSGDQRVAHDHELWLPVGHHAHMADGA